ncbi:uncharacterized protein LOC133169593 [Syngnathus typhle]|uniref:uncharacterized protein LOC133169593 n=1 Tax=Syngnathus typhle TaxID=161592 RepID=UPI002A6B70CC|nr:uncharacterized protein LOC133169593 [Syngnathus typhle]
MDHLCGTTQTLADTQRPQSQREESRFGRKCVSTIGIEQCRLWVRPQRTSSPRQKQEEAQERLEANTKDTVQPGDKVYVKVFRRKWFNERRQGPFEVVRCTGTAVQVQGSPTWYHLTHCVKVPKDEDPQRGRRDCETAEPLPEQESPEGPDRDKDGHDQAVVDNVSAEPVPEDIAGSTADDRGNQQFNDINRDDAPSPGADDDPQHNNTEPTTARGSAPREQRHPAGPSGGRPVRHRVRPERYIEQC